MTAINMLLSANDAHAPYAAAVIQSAIAHARPDDVLTAYVLAMDLSDDSRRKFAEFSQESDIDVYLVEDTEDRTAGLAENRLPRATYLRMFAGEMLPDVDRAIYLDTDILVRCSLSEMLDAAEGDQPIGVIPDIAFDLIPEVFEGETHDEFDLTKYFNAGVMVLDLAYMREVDAGRKLYELGLNHKTTKFHDQSLLNILFENKTVMMPLTYNYMLYYFDESFFDGLPQMQDLHDLYHDPKIVHFVRYKKPWNWKYPQRFAAEYRRHLRATPWGAEAIDDVTLKRLGGYMLRAMRYYPRMLKYRLSRRLRSS